MAGEVIAYPLDAKQNLSQDPAENIQPKALTEERFNTLLYEALIGELILHDIISVLRCCHLNYHLIGRFKCSRFRTTAIHLVFNGSHRSLIKLSGRLRLRGQIKPAAYMLLGPTGWNLSHSWLAKSHFTLLASPETLWATTIRQTTSDPL